MRINRFIALFFFGMFLFPLIIQKEAWGEERDDIKKQMQELRQQMEAMQKKLEELEEKNRMLEEEAKKQKEEREVEKAITEAVPAPPREGYLQRVIQSLNPDISVIGIFTAAYFSENDPIIHAENDPENTGINLQEIEIGFQGVIDPYFRFDSFFSIGRDSFETEEAYATTLLSLPLNSQVRIGLMRAKFGRINLQHRHSQDFVTLALPAADFLGEHLNPVGIEFNFLAPLPWFMELTASVNSANGLETPTFAPDEDANNLGRLLYIFHLANFFEITEALSLSLGGSFATGSNGTEPGNRSNLYGVDLFAKYRPLKNNPYQEVWLQSEFMYLQAESEEGDLDNWGAYAQLVYRFAKRWNAGFRFDFVDTDTPVTPMEEEELEGSSLLRVMRSEEGEEEESMLGLLGKELRYAVMLTFNPTEFSRIRLQYEFDDPDFADSFHAVFLQFQYSLGAHGAHPF
ncbi:MAG TPA: hypothetical protein VNN20_15985 [Thermodesulfobacteriota bacterium]|nr:hypothetical protein [Thermodesulfobacteriota bacterium]